MPMFQAARQGGLTSLARCVNTRSRRIPIGCGKKIWHDHVVIPARFSLVQEARSLRSAVLAERQNSEVLQSSCRVTVEESRRLIAKSKRAIAALHAGSAGRSSR
jgi:hypothetical protein